MFVDFNILNQLGSPSINSNTFANRPAAGQTGRLFVSTDTFEIYRDNGTGWDLIGGPGSSTVTGSGATGQVTYWTGTNTVSGENALFWDAAQNHLGINTATPGVALDVHSAADIALQLNGTGATPTVLQQFLSAGVAQYELGYNWNANADYRRFSIYDTAGAKEVISIDQQSRYVGINYQYSTLADQPAYTLDVSGSGRFTDSGYFATASGKVLIGLTTSAFSEQTETTGAIRFGTYLIRGNLGTRYDDPGLLMGGGDNTIPLQLVTPPNTFDLFRFYTTGFNNSTTGSAIKGSFSANSNTANFEMQAYNNAVIANGNIVFNKNGGNFGVGGTPTQTLHVFSTTDGQGAIIENTTARSALTMKSTSGASCYVNFQTTGSSNNAFFDFRSASDYFNMATSFAAGYIAFQTGVQQERVRITSGGNFLIGTTTDAGQKLQVSGVIYTTTGLNINTTSTDSAQLKVNGTIGVNDYNQNTYLYVTGGIAGQRVSAFVGTYAASGSVTLATFSRVGGAVSADIKYDDSLSPLGISYGTTTNHALYFFTNNTTALLIKNDQTAEFTQSIKTAAPTTGTAAAWKLGQRVAAAVVLDATQYIEVEVGGTFYKLAIVT
jgi:hypothetical protein